ncbi:hypothetical protein AAA587_02735 [Pseudomonas aeruginosa]|nr:hypothetical protein [Pseudomonas aeruginosa]
MKQDDFGIQIETVKELMTRLRRSRLSRREKIWILIYFKSKYPSSVNSEIIDSPILNQTIFSMILANPRALLNINTGLCSELLEEKLLAWITEEKIQHEWIINKINKTITSKNIRPKNLYGIAPTKITSKDYLIATIDTWGIELSEKNKILIDIKNEWTSKRNPYNHFNWALNADERYISTCIWDWLKNRSASIPPPQTAFRNLEEVMQYFNLVSTSEYELKAIKKYTKNRWYQKTYRENLKGKKQQNLILSEKAISHLKMLSKRHSIKRNEVIELLLKLEVEQRLYLKQALKTMHIDD